MKRPAAGPIRSRSIVRRVMILVLTGLTASLALLGTVSWLNVRDLEREMYRQREVRARWLARYVDERFTDVQATLQAVATTIRPYVSAPPAVLAEALRARYLESGVVDGLALADRSGRVLASEPASSLLTKAWPGQRLREMLEGGRPAISDVLRDEQGRRYIVLVVPVSGYEGQPLGLAVGELALDGRRFATISESLASHDLGHLSLVDSAGELVYCNYGHATAAAETGQALASARLSTTPWTLVVGLEPGVGTRMPLSLIWGLVAPVLLVLAWLFARGAAASVRRPLVALTREAERIEAGDLTRAIPPMADDEVGRLARAFEHMRVALSESLASVAADNAALERRVAERTRELAALNEELRAREETRAQLLRKVIRAQEDERKRIARELHDEIGQTLTALAVRLDLAHAAAVHGPAEPAVADARALATRSLDELHRLMHDLRPSVLDDLGLCAGLRWFADRHLTRHGVSVRFEVTDWSERLPAELETALFRAAQEAMTNVERHARADHVLVQCGVQDGRLTIEIEDDGEGFDPATTTPRPGEARGLGLMGMRERVELFGGTVAFDSEPGEGTRVLIGIPLPSTIVNRHVEDPRPDR